MRTVTLARLWSVAILAGCLLVITGCQTVPITGRKGLDLISADQEMQLGLTSFDQIKSNTPVSHDPAVNAMVKRVGEQIARVAGKDMPNAQWEFVVFESKEANAFCLPGGKVGVYTGILPITKSEAGLATVLGHEVAHAVAHHGAERMSQQMVVQMGGQALASSLGGADPGWQKAAMVAYGVGSQVGVMLPYSRAHESEADHIGLIYMARAGYQPEEAVSFWERFSQYEKSSGGSGTPGFLRTHPLDEVRIQQLREWLPEAKAEYQKASSH
jgi:metalloendopeptidase OMA1, mitochondrial